MTAFTITTDLEVPRTADETGIPADWALDSETGASARGFLFEVLTYAAPGVEVTQDTLGPGHPDDDGRVGEYLAELVDRGYLTPAGGDRYTLVHPDRFEPLPPARPAST